MATAQNGGQEAWGSQRAPDKLPTGRLLPGPGGQAQPWTGQRCASTPVKALSFFALSINVTANFIVYLFPS